MGNLASMDHFDDTRSNAVTSSSFSSMSAGRGIGSRRRCRHVSRTNIRRFGSAKRKKDNPSHTRKNNQKKNPFLTCGGIGTFTANDSNLLIFGAHLEAKQVKCLTKQACARNAFNVKRISFLSCCSVLNDGNHQKELVQSLTVFLQTHAPNLEWLLITNNGTLLATETTTTLSVAHRLCLLETNQDAIHLLENMPCHKLQRLCFNIGRQATNVDLATTLAHVLNHKALNLQTLNLRGMAWTNVDAMQVWAPSLATHDSLLTLDLAHCRMTNQVFHHFVQAIASSTSTCKLVKLNLASNHLHGDVSCLEDVCTLLATACPDLQSLNLSHMPFLFVGFDAVAVAGVPPSAATPEQHQRRPPLQDESAAAAAAAALIFAKFLKTLQQATRLQELNISNTGLSVNTMKQVLQAAASCTSSIQTLHLCNHPAVSAHHALQILTHQLNHFNNDDDDDVADGGLHLSALFLSNLGGGGAGAGAGAVTTVATAVAAQNAQENEARAQGGSDEEQEGGYPDQIRMTTAIALFLQALHSNTTLTKLSFLDDDDVDDDDHHHHCGIDWATRQRIHAILQRNWLTRMMMHTHNMHPHDDPAPSPPLSVWPRFLALSSTSSALCYQLLQQQQPLILQLRRQTEDLPAITTTICLQ